MADSEVKSDEGPWHTAKVPDNVWAVAIKLQALLALRGIQVLPHEFLVPKFCPRCSKEGVVETTDLIHCPTCDYKRPNLVHKGRNLSLGEIVGLAAELVHHLANGTLSQRVADAWRLF